MANGYVERKGAVETFLLELKRVLNDKNVILDIENRKDKPKEYTNVYCMRLLKYNQNDVKNELLKLTSKEYVETCDDIRRNKTSKFYVFDKMIKNKEVYIKVKIKSYDNKNVLCMSFHFAEEHISKFPYR